MESIGVSKDEFDVCENFEADISFANNRYEVKLSFKSEHGMLDGNYLLCKSLLKNLFNGKFRKDLDLFKRYNEIIKDQFLRYCFILLLTLRKFSQCFKVLIFNIETVFC